MCTHDGGVHAHLPHDAIRRVGEGLQHFQDESPAPGPLPSVEQSVYRLPRTIVRWRISPRFSGAGAPPDTVDELSFRPFRRAVNSGLAVTRLVRCSRLSLSESVVARGHSGQNAQHRQRRSAARRFA